MEKLAEVPVMAETLDHIQKYCFKNGMTSALSLGNGGGTHLGCCAPVFLLTKSAILVKASEFFFSLCLKRDYRKRKEEEDKKTLCISTENVKG